MKTPRYLLWALLSSTTAMAVACSSTSDDDQANPPGGSSVPTEDASPDDDAASQPGDDGGAETSSPPSDGAASTTVEEACSALADAICSKVQTCTSFGLAAYYIDLPTCKERQMLACTTSAAAPAQTATPDAVKTCASSIPTLDCNDVVALDFGPSCAFAGTRQDGQPCGYNAECASTFCAIAPDQSCGVCAPATAEGDACVDGSCSAGLSCSEVDARCYRPGTGQVGAPCARLADCDLAHGSGCNTMSHQCITVTLAVGGACGADSVLGTSYATCPGGAACAPQINGHCAPIARDGEPCGADGPSCLLPARCVAGTCTLPSPSCQ